jgi:hypothetical protein
MIRLLKTLPLTAVAALGIAATAWADGASSSADHRLEKAFGSTIVSTYPDGRQAELWLKRDGTYTAEGRRRVDRSNGTWQIKDDKLCMKQHAPIPAPFAYCTPVPEGGIDRPWTGKAYTGEQITIKLVKGVFDPGKNGAAKGAATEAGASKARASKAEAEQN